jgi:hypothetical protein
VQPAIAAAAPYASSQPAMQASIAAASQACSIAGAGAQAQIAYATLPPARRPRARACGGGGGGGVRWARRGRSVAGKGLATGRQCTRWSVEKGTKPTHLPARHDSP